MSNTNTCDKCKAHCGKPKSQQRVSPCGSSARASSTPRGCPLNGTNPNKPVYVRMEPSEKTCIVVGKNDGGCGGNSIQLHLPTSSPSPKCGGGNPSSSKMKCGGGPSSGSSGGGNCIEIVGSSIIKSANGGLQILPCKGGRAGGGNSKGMQICMGKGGCPVVQLGAGPARNCGSSSSSGCLQAGGGTVQVCPSSNGQVKVNFGKGKCGGGPSIICGPGSSNVEINLGPQKRKLDMNHCKPTIAFMIHKRLVELETELRMAECAYSDMHPAYNNC